MPMDTYLDRNRDFITQSKIRCFRFCPKRFELEYLQELPTEKSDAMYLGLAFDDLVTLGEEQWSNRWQVVDRRKDPESELTKLSREKVFGGLGEFRRQPLASLDAEFEKQKEIVVEFPPVKLKGTIDRYDAANRVIRDTKFTGSLVRFDPGTYLDQLSFYAYLLFWEAEQKEGQGFFASAHLDVCDHEGRSAFFRFSADTLKAHGAGWIPQAVADLSAAVRTNSFPANPGVRRENCLSCPMYRHCPHSVQEDFYDA